MKHDKTNVNWKKLGDLIRTRRDDRGLSQTDIAKELGIDNPQFP